MELCDWYRLIVNTGTGRKVGNESVAVSAPDKTETELQIRRDTGDNSKIIFPISQRKIYIVTPL